MSRSPIDRLMRRVDALEAERRELMNFIRHAERSALPGASGRKLSSHSWTGLRRLMDIGTVSGWSDIAL